eukprot:scaffold8235_cov118-Isochrysis_galbana.AAC.1
MPDGLVVDIHIFLSIYYFAVSAHARSRAASGTLPGPALTTLPLVGAAGLALTSRVTSRSPPAVTVPSGVGSVLKVRTISANKNGYTLAATHWATEGPTTATSQLLPVSLPPFGPLPLPLCPHPVSLFRPSYAGDGPWLRALQQPRVGCGQPGLSVMRHPMPALTSTSRLNKGSVLSNFLMFAMFVECRPMTQLFCLASSNLSVLTFGYPCPQPPKYCVFFMLNTNVFLPLLSKPICTFRTVAVSAVLRRTRSNHVLRA